MGAIFTPPLHYWDKAIGSHPSLFNLLFLFSFPSFIFFSFFFFGECQLRAPPLLDSRAPGSPRGKLLPTSDVPVFTSGAGDPVSAAVTQGKPFEHLALGAGGWGWGDLCSSVPWDCDCWRESCWHATIPREMHNGQTEPPSQPQPF